MRTVSEILAAGPLVGVGVWDALSAKLAADAGASAVFLSGYCLSASRLGEPDVGLITGTEMLEAASRVVAAVDVPVIVDIDTGWGDARNVERAVRELVRLGAAGCFLEDQTWPKRCGHMDGKQVVPLEEYLPKLTAALETRGAAPFHVTARTDARAVHGLDEAIRRACAFAEAGADAVFVEAPESIDEMARVRAAVPADVPLVANMVEHGKTPLRPAAELAQAGYAIVVFPVTGILAAARAVRDAFHAVVTTGRPLGDPARAMGFEALNAFLGLAEHDRRTRRS